MTHHNCPKEIEWQRIDFRPLMKIIESIVLKESHQMVVPDHLIQPNIRQQYMVIRFTGNEDIETA